MCPVLVPVIVLHTVTENSGGLQSLCLNGRSFVGNTPTIMANMGQKIRWYVFNLDLSMVWHNFHPHAQRWNFADAGVGRIRRHLYREYARRAVDRRSCADASGRRHPRLQPDAALRRLRVHCRRRRNHRDRAAGRQRRPARLVHAVHRQRRPRPVGRALDPPALTPAPRLGGQGRNGPRQHPRQALA